MPPHLKGPVPASVDSPESGVHLCAESEGINLYAEYSLHDSLKRLAAGPDGRIEVPVDGWIADAVRKDGELVEIQTAKLGSILGKVSSWIASGYRVRVQFPLVTSKVLVKLDGATGVVISKRRSPTRKSIWNLFDELIRASGIIATPGLVFEVIFVEAVEYRKTEKEPVRRGRFARTITTVDRSLAAVGFRMEFNGPADWLALLPPLPPEGWTSMSLGEALGIPAPAARKVLYSLARAGLLEAMPRSGRMKRYTVRGV